uniref:Uncharacterized protein n=1 Tax=Arundo donax TaxID=35708 RepID=A0A0A9BIM7_ARUDO
MKNNNCFGTNSNKMITTPFPIFLRMFRRKEMLPNMLICSIDCYRQI